MCVVASVRFWGRADSREVLQHSKAEKHRPDGDAQHRHAVRDEVMVKHVLHVKEALIESGHTTYCALHQVPDHCATPIVDRGA